MEPYVSYRSQSVIKKIKGGGRLKDAVFFLTIHFTNYRTKLHTRVGGPWYMDTDLYRTENSIDILHKWQE